MSRYCLQLLGVEREREGENDDNQWMGEKIFPTSDDNGTPVYSTSSLAAVAAALSLPPSLALVRETYSSV